MTSRFSKNGTSQEKQRNDRVVLSRVGSLKRIKKDLLGQAEQRLPFFMYMAMELKMRWSWLTGDMNKFNLVAANLDEGRF